MFCKTSEELFTSKIKNTFIKQRITISRIKSNLAHSYLNFEANKTKKKRSLLLNTALTLAPTRINTPKIMRTQNLLSYERSGKLLAGGQVYYESCRAEMRNE